MAYIYRGDNGLRRRTPGLPTDVGGAGDSARQNVVNAYNEIRGNGGSTGSSSGSGDGGYGGMDWAKYLEDYMSQARSAINNAYKENIRQSGMTYEGSDKPTLARRAEAQERWLNQNTSPNSGAYMSGRLDIANTLNSGLANARRDRATRDANYRIQRDQELANINSNAMNLMLPYLMSKMM